MPCAVPGCATVEGRMLCFPVDKGLADKWKAAVGITAHITQRSRICPKHFRPEDLAITGNNKVTRRSRGAIPFAALPATASQSVGSQSKPLRSRSTGSCCVRGCKSSNMKLHAFPKSVSQRAAWAKACGLPDSQGTLPRSLVVCADHFKDSDYFMRGTTPGKTALKQGSVPTLNLKTANGNGDDSDDSSAALGLFNSSSEDSENDEPIEKKEPEEIPAVVPAVKAEQGVAKISIQVPNDDTKTINRKRKSTFSLSYLDKVDIVSLYESGALVSKICDEYGITKHTMYLLLMDKAKYKKAGETSNIFVAPHQQLENAMVMWLTEAASIGKPVTGGVLLSRVNDFNVKLGGDPKFKANSVWLDKFKDWYTDLATEFNAKSNGSACDSTKARKILKELSFVDKIAQVRRANLYNADEIALFWRNLPDTMLTDKVHSLNRDRVAVLCCANSTGTHRLEPLIIGEGQKRDDHPDDEDLLPFSFIARPGGFVDKDVFLEWYRDTFIPQVMERQSEDGQRGKVLLIIDRAACHPPEDVLNAVDPNFRVMCLPTSEPPHHQPLQQGALEQLRRIYRLRLLERLALEEPVDLAAILEFQQGLDISDAGQLVAISWDDVPAADLTRGWWTLPGESSSSTTDRITDTSDSAFMATLCRIPASIKVCGEDLQRWISCDKHEPIQSLLSDEQIVTETLKEALRLCNKIGL